MSIAELQQAYPRPPARDKSADPQMTPRALYDRPPPEKRPIRIVAEMQSARLVRAIESERRRMTESSVRPFVCAGERNRTSPFSDFRNIAGKHHLALGKSSERV